MHRAGLVARLLVLPAAPGGTAAGAARGGARALASSAAAAPPPPPGGFFLTAPGRPARPIRWQRSGATSAVAEPAVAAAAPVIENPVGEVAEIARRLALGAFDMSPRFNRDDEDHEEEAWHQWRDMWAHSGGSMVLLRVRGEHSRDLARHWDNYGLHHKLGPAEAAEWGALDTLTDDR